jgi:hypothetical protein
MRGHEANTSLLNDNLAKKQTLRTEKLQGRAIKPVRPLVAQMNFFKAKYPRSCYLRRV